MRERVLAVLFGVLTLSLAYPAAAACTLGKIAELPVIMEDESPLVRAKVNDKEALFLVDSGAFFSLISPGVADELHLPRTAAPQMLDEVEGVGGSADVTVATIDTLEVAGVTFRKAEFFVGGSGIGVDVAGVIGQNVLSFADVEYDLRDGVIRLMRPKDCGERPLAYWDSNQPFSALDISRSGRKLHTTASAEVNGVTIKVMFDTGASYSMLTEEAAKRAGIDLKADDVRSTGRINGIGRQTVASWVAPVTSFKIGDEEIRNTRLRIAATSLSEDTDMLLGADFFLSHRVYVANSQGKLYFTYAGGPVFNLSTQTQAASAPAPPPEGAEPTGAAGFAGRGAASASRRAWAAAIADFDRAIALDPKQPEYFFQRAAAQAQSGRSDQALADLDQAISLRPDYLLALTERASMRLARKDPAGAKADLEAADKFAPRQDDARMELAVLFDHAGDFAETVRQYDLWIAAHPDDARAPEALNGRCWARAEMNSDLDRALSDCNAALRRAPKTANFLDSRGLAHLRRGELDAAIADYSAALALRPKLTMSLYGRGLAEQKQGLADKAKADIAAAIALDPSLPDEAKRIGLSPG